MSLVKLRKVIKIFRNVLSSILIIGNVNATDVLILSNSAAEVEQFKNNRGQYLNVETNRIIFEDIKGDYTLNHEYVPRAREVFKMALSIPTCSINNIKTAERSEHYHFSLPVNLYSTLRLYHKSSEALLPSSLLDESGSVKSLVDLFAVQLNKNILLVKDIEYPAMLQRQIDILDPAQVLFLKNSELNGGNVQLIERDRANYIVDYPQVVNDWYAKKGFENTLRSYAIAGMEPLVAGHLMCNASALESGFLSAINASILKLYRDGSFYAIYTNFLNQAEVERINRYLATLLQVDTYNASSS